VQPDRIIKFSGKALWFQAVKTDDVTGFNAKETCALLSKLLKLATRPH
jgi:hypothetical protein